MGVPTSEVGYTPAMPRREDHEVHKGHVVALGEKKNKSIKLRYRGAEKFLARPGRKQTRKHVRDGRDFNNIETRAVIKFYFPARQGAEGNLRHSDGNISIFHSCEAKDLSASLYPCTGVLISS